jgi:hypothetical protein
MRRRRAARTNPRPLPPGPLLAVAVTVLGLGLGACTGLAEMDPNVRRGPSGAAAVDESQAAAIATGGEQMVTALRRGGFVLVFQHTAAERRSERRVDLTHCSTQRNLSATGRQQAIQLGITVRALHIPVANVVTSPFCRARDTGWLAFGRAEAGADLAPPPAGSAEAATATGRFRARLSTPPPLGTNTALVTHTETIASVLGVQLKPGEVLAYQARAGEQPLLLKRFTIATLVAQVRSGAKDTQPSALPSP